MRSKTGLAGHLAGWAPFLVLLLAFMDPVKGSEGDASSVFQDCHAACVQTGCTKTPGDSNTCDVACARQHHTFQPPWILRVMGWDCAADCSYHCMWAIEGPKARAAVGPVYKYFGKWPFIRVLGAQEIASVLFSIANMLAHIHNLQLMWQHHRAQAGCKVSTYAATHGRAATAAAGQYPYIWLWMLYSAANINAWLWSSVFHCRDTRVTERLDYFSADTTIAIGLAVSLVRVLQLQTRPPLCMLGLLLSSVLLQHIHYMAFVKFDYGYNMKVCIAVGVLTAAVWLTWVTKVRHPARRTVYQFMSLVHAAMLLEVLDFPPLFWLMDAHALWHVATVPLTYLWYRFVMADISWVMHGYSAVVNQQLGVLETAAKQKQ